MVGDLGQTSSFMMGLRLEYVSSGLVGSILGEKDKTLSLLQFVPTCFGQSSDESQCDLTYSQALLCLAHRLHCIPSQESEPLMLGPTDLYSVAICYTYVKPAQLVKGLICQGANIENNRFRKVSRFVVLESVLRKQNLAGLLPDINAHDIAQLYTSLLCLCKAA